jgi:hypothetical protein
MALAGLFGQPKLTLEEAKAIREVRQIFYSKINTASSTATAAVKLKTMTPDTAKAINTVLNETRAWLSANPKASYEEIGAKYEDFESKIQNLIDEDKPRVIVLTTIQSISFLADAAVQQGVINSQQNAALKQYQKEQQAWFDKNAMNTSALGLADKVQEILDKIKEVTNNPQLTENIEKQTENPEAAKAAIAEQKKKVEEEKNAPPVKDFRSGASYAAKIAGQVVGYFLLVVLCGMAGSLAANAAIGRPPAYRILYFLYGCIPLFAPFVLIGALLRRMNKGPQSWYGILPISIEPAITRFGKFLWFPFYWVPDQKAIDAAKEWIDMMKSVADAPKV